MLIRASIAGFATLALGACAGTDDDGRSTAKVSEIEWTSQQGGQTTLGRLEITYQGDHVKEVAFRENGVAAGTMDFDYQGDKLEDIDVTDAEGDQGSYVWRYTDDRLSSIRWSVAEILTAEQEFDYDDANGGRAKRVTSTTSWIGATPTSVVATYDYDDQDRLEEVTSVEGSTTRTAELRYDDRSRVERYTEYVGSDFTIAELSYDEQGRLSVVESDDDDRYEISYDADGLIEEILILDPSAGQTMTVRYRYVAGGVTGLTFDPNLPVAGLIDLRGQPFDHAAFTAFAPPLGLPDVPAIEISSCSHDVCVAGTALDASCDPCAAAVCNQDSFCCGSSWDATCVGLVPSACGFTC